MRFLLIVVLLGFSFAAQAVEPPAGQTPVGTQDVLRGQFFEEHLMKGFDSPTRATGSFTLAPARGLIWNIQQPFQTTTIVTQNGMVQNMGGISVRMPIKNLRHLYDMISGALAGSWDGLASDFVITPKGNASHWQMLLTPRPGAVHKTSYATITVSGGKFVENIAAVKGDGTYDSFSFSQVMLSSGPLPNAEIASFNKATQ